MRAATLQINHHQNNCPTLPILKERRWREASTKCNCCLISLACPEKLEQVLLGNDAVDTVGNKAIAYIY